MERSEPSLVPEWLRGNGGSGLSHHFASSQAGKNSSNIPRRSSSRNRSCIRHDKNSYLRSYSSSRNQSSKDFDKSGGIDTWDFEYSGSLTSITVRRLENGTLERSKSMNSGRAVEFSQSRAFADVRNRSHDVKSNVNGAGFVDSGSTGSQRVAFERDFPVFGYVGGPMCTDIVRVPSPGLNNGVEGLSIGTSPLLGREGWNSALAEVPAGARGSDSVGSSHRQLQSSDTALDLPTPASISSASNGLSVAEALAKAPVRSHSGPQQSMQMQRCEELASMGTKKLVPMTPLMPKNTVLNPSDKLKPKTVARSNDVAVPKNGLQLMLSSKLRNGSSPTDGPKLSSGVLLLKPGREKSGSAALKDIGSTVANSSYPGVTSISSAPSKNSNSVKHPVTDRRTAAYGSNVVSTVDKRVSLAQLRSRNDFLNLIRKKSTVSTSSTLAVVTGEREVAASGSASSENCEVKCNGDACKLAQNCSDRQENTVTQYQVIHPEEELELLKQMGWNDDAGDDEGLTEEEINAFVQKYMTSKHAPKLLRGLQIHRTADSSGVRASNT